MRLEFRSYFSEVFRRVTCRAACWFVATACVCTAIGCSSRAPRRGFDVDEPEGLHVDPAAYGADAFTYNKAMSTRPASSDVFYFKHCASTGHQTWYSKTDYACTLPW